MAVVTVDTDLNQTVGVPYTVITDTSSDWPNVGNSIYFFDKEDKLVHYKNASGIVISTYSGGSNISTSNLTSDGSYGLDLNGNTLVLGGTSVIASEGISLQKDILVKGSNNLASTSGFKITDINNNSLLDIKNSGKIIISKAQTGVSLESYSNLSVWAGVSNSSVESIRVSAGTNYSGVHFIDNNSVVGGSTSGNIFLKGNFGSSTESLVNLNDNIEFKTKSSKTVKFFTNNIQFINDSDSVTYGRIISDVFVWGGAAGSFLSPIGTEKFSIQVDTLIKGSNNSASTSGFKVTDVNNLSLLDIKNDGVVTITRPASATTNSALMIDSSASGVGAGAISINQGASNFGLSVYGDNNSIIHTFKNSAGINGMSMGETFEGYLLGVYNNGASLGGGMFLNSSFQSSGGSYGGIGLGYGTDIGVISGLDKDIVFYMTSTKLHSFKSTGEVVIGATSSNASAKLQVDSTTQGFAGPRMTTTERNAISTPLAGLEVYDTTLNSKMIYNGTSWDSLLPAGGGSGTKVLVQGRMNTTQTVPQSTDTTIDFVSSVTGGFDVNSEWDNTNNKFVVGSSGAGTYQFMNAMFFPNNSGWSRLSIKKNGTPIDFYYGSGWENQSNSWEEPNGSWNIELVVGDEVEFCLYSTGGFTFNATYHKQNCFQITKLSAVAPAAGTDVNALHTNISGEITALTAKATPTTSDVLVIEDAADSNNKKKSTLASIKNTVAPILTKTLTLEAPTASDDITIFKTDRAITVQEVIAVNVGTSPSTTYQLKYNAARNNAGTALTTSSSTTSVVGGNVATLSNASIPADNWVWLETSAASGTNVFLTIDIRYTED